MSTQIPLPSIPLPSFEEIRKILNFWIDQQDKWFYFEGDKMQTGSEGRVTHSPPPLARTSSPWDDKRETIQYIQSRIAGRIKDVVPYPPSLLLDDVFVFTALFSIDNLNGYVISRERRNAYGLVFSQITYYEPIQDLEAFLQKDARIKYEEKDSNEY
ncbi:MAG: hypothetical protein AB1607_17595 [Chloroflexota bacterium]